MPKIRFERTGAGRPGRLRFGTNCITDPDKLYQVYTVAEQGCRDPPRRDPATPMQIGRGHRWQAALADPELQFGGHMASAEREPITGVWGRSPQRGPGAEPLHGHGVRGRSPPEAESINF